ncbi:hypothetical protein, partial [Vibrio cholerae]|uniref:hypothetical protein n=1 Tax=Vibrio cholerae TaxID=666 RepID=UPI001C109358
MNTEQKQKPKNLKTIHNQLSKHTQKQKNPAITSRTNPHQNYATTAQNETKKPKNRDIAYLKIK